MNTFQPITKIQDLNEYLLELLRRAAPYLEDASLSEHVAEYLSFAASWSRDHEFYKRFYYVNPYSRYTAWCIWYRTHCYNLERSMDPRHMEEFHAGIRKLEAMVQARESLHQ